MRGAEAKCRWKRRKQPGMTLPAARLLRAVVLDLRFGSFVGVMLRVGVMPMRQVGVVGGLLMLARFVVRGGLLVMMGSQFMVMSGVSVVFGGLL